MRCLLFALIMHWAKVICKVNLTITWFLNFFTVRKHRTTMPDLLKIQLEKKGMTWQNNRPCNTTRVIRFLQKQLWSHKAGPTRSLGRTKKQKNPICLVPRGTGVCRILNSAPDWSDFQGTILDLENNTIHCSLNYSLLSFSVPDWLRLIEVFITTETLMGRASETKLIEPLSRFKRQVVALSHRVLTEQL